MKKKIILISGPLALLILVVAIFAIALLPKSSQREQEIKTAINEANFCKQDSDCVNLGSACPFGCSIFVHKSKAQKISNLIRSYNSTCIYDCLLCPTAVCKSGKCEKVCE